jgi:hypothetical protein
MKPEFKAEDSESAYMAYRRIRICSVSWEIILGIGFYDAAISDRDPDFEGCWLSTRVHNYGDVCAERGGLGC